MRQKKGTGSFSRKKTSQSLLQRHSVEGGDGGVGDADGDEAARFDAVRGLGEHRDDVAVGAAPPLIGALAVPFH